MSSNQTIRLVLLGIEYSPDDRRAVYELEADGTLVRFSATPNTAGGIRHVVVPDEFENFLWKYITHDNRVIQRLVSATWHMIDGHPLPMPIELVTQGSPSD